MTQGIYNWVEGTPLLQKIVLVGLATCLAFLLFFFIIVGPKTVERETLQAKIGQFELEISQQQAKLDRLSVLKEQVKQLQEQVSAQRKLLGLHRDSKWLLQQFTNSARTLGVTITLLKPGPHTHNLVLQTEEYPIKLRVKGEFHRIAMLLSRIGRLPKILQVTGFQFRGLKEVSPSNGDYTVSAEISFIGYAPSQTLSSQPKRQPI